MKERRRPSAWLGALLRDVERRTQERPYPALALALVVGYVAGGGFFSPFTRPLARAAMGTLLVPGIRDRVREFVDDIGLREGIGAA
jgi:hypothetical protein